MIKRCILIAAMIGTLSHSFAQNVKGTIGIDISHKSNSLTAGAGTNTIGVDLYTGTATVGIPIYQYSTAGLDLGVSLSYLAKGVKVNQYSSSVGLGWELNYGGSITRKVNGLEDEVTLPITYLSALSDSMQGRMVPGANLVVGTETCDDIEPDIFTANFGGRTVEFMFTYDGNNVVCETRPHLNIQIQPYTEDFSGSTYTNTRTGFKNKSGLDKTHDILNFNITDEQGNLFIFKRGDYRYKTYSFPAGTFSPHTSGAKVDSGTYYPTESWNLVTVVTITGKTISYDYMQKNVNYLENVSTTLNPIYVTLPAPYDSAFVVSNEYYKGIKTHISSIVYPNFKYISFILDTTAAARCDNKSDFRLDKIMIKNAQQNPISFRFNQALFNSPTTGMTATEYAIPSACSTLVSSMIVRPQYINYLGTITIDSTLNQDSVKEAHLARGMRLKLKSIDKIGTDNSTSENYYSFAYNSTALPDRFDCHQDFYGYFNNKTNYPFIMSDFWNWHKTDTINLTIPYHLARSGFAYSSSDHHVYTGDGTYWGQDRSYDYVKAQAFSLRALMNCSGARDSLVYQNYTLTNPTCSYSRTMGYAYSATQNVHPDLYNGCTIDTLLVGDTCNDGLVISKVVSMDGYSTQNTSITEYSFEDGQRFNRGGYTWYTNGQSVNYAVETDYFVNPHEYVNNSNHGFGKATVISKGYLGQQLAKSVDYFTNLMFKDASNNDTSCVTAITGLNYHTCPPGMLKYRMGLPTKEETYDKNNFLTNRREYSYEYKTSGPLIQGYKLFSSVAFNYYTINRSFDNEYFRLTGSKDTSYISTNKMVVTHDYKYDGNENVYADAWKDSKGDTYRQYLTFTGVAHPKSSSVWKMNSGTDSVLISYNLAAAETTGYFKYPANYVAVLSAPATSSSLSTIFNLTNALAFDTSGNYGPNLLKVFHCHKYDSDHNQVEIQYNNVDQYESRVYDSTMGWLNAQVSNARYADIAYSGFEGNDYAADSRGNWVYYGTGTDIAGGITGTKSFFITGDTIKSGALHHKKYMLSFWCKYNAIGFPDVWLRSTGGGTSAITMTKRNGTATWDYFTAIIEPAEGDKLYMHGIDNSAFGTPSAYVDELRLYPLDASMTSYTYLANIGMSSMVDNSGYINYYEYDKLGRLTYVRDVHGNVLKAVKVSCGSPWSAGVNYDH